MAQLDDRPSSTAMITTSSGLSLVNVEPATSQPEPNLEAGASVANRAIPGEQKNFHSPAMTWH